MRQKLNKVFLVLLLLILLVGITHVTLYAKETGEKFHFIVLGDRTGGHQDSVFQKLLTEATRLQPDFFINVGDLIEGYTDDEKTMNKEWDELLGFFKKTGIPYHFVPGNHDIWSKKSEEIFNKRCGKPYYSFDFKGSHFIVLDTSRENRSLPEEQLNWLKSDLKTNQDKQHIFVFYHKPFWYENFKKNRDDALHRLFVANKVDTVFTGHYHQYCETVKDGVRYVSVGSSGGHTGTHNDNRGHFHHYLWVTVKPDKTDFAVLKAGSVFPVSVIKMKDQFAYEKIQDKGIIIGYIPIKGEKGKCEGVVEYEIVNILKKPTQVNFKWNNAPKRWEISPSGGKFTLQPGEKRKFTSKVVVHDKSKLYPLPKLEVKYDYKDKKAIPFLKPMNIKRKAEISKIQGKIKVDGILNEDCWKKITPLTGFIGIYGNETDAEKTEVYIAYDKKNIYVGALCKESNTDKMQAKKCKRDTDIFNQDFIMIMLAPKGKKYPLYQFIVNPMGVIMDRKCDMKDKKLVKDTKWNGKIQVATNIDKDSWTVEMIIPFAAIEGKSNQTWNFNIARRQRSLGIDTTWHLPYSYNPANMGNLMFK